MNHETDVKESWQAKEDAILSADIEIHMAINAALDNGHTLNEVGSWVGISGERVRQLRDKEPMPLKRRGPAPTRDLTAKPKKKREKPKPAPVRREVPVGLEPRTRPTIKPKRPGS